MARIVHAQDPQKYNIALAAALKNVKELNAPEWVAFVKSGVSKERVPVDPDFWYVRTASVLRQLYIQGVVGVEKLRTRYGSKKNRGARKSKFKKSSGKMIRVILQQCEAAGLVEKMDTLQHGRRLTEKGRLFLDGIKVGDKE
jgi:small subunit ribosomal protein S19e